MISEYSDEDLIDVFWCVNRDKYPVRYQEICTELEKRGIEFKDLKQWQRNQMAHDEKLEEAALVYWFFAKCLKFFVMVLTSLGLVWGAINKWLM